MQKLIQKVLCSLLAAGMINVCISGGDVWAAESEPNIVNIASPSTDHNGGSEYRYAGVFLSDRHRHTHQPLSLLFSLFS